MKNSLSSALVAIAALAVTSCGLTPGNNKPTYEIPDTSNACNHVNLNDGHIDNDAEFLALFDCLNNEGSLQTLEPMIQDLANTINPQTGAPYLDDLIVVANGVLGDQA